MQVRECMTSGARFIEPGTSLKEAARTMRTENVGALPIGENDRLIGMVTDRDITVRGVAEEREPEKTTVRDVMSADAYCCREDDDLDQAARMMAEHQVQRLPVLNAQDRLVGMLAVSDMARSDKNAAMTAVTGIKAPSEQPRH
jgi:CBS domain-containing protein